MNTSFEFSLQKIGGLKAVPTNISWEGGGGGGGKQLIFWEPLTRRDQVSGKNGYEYI